MEEHFILIDLERTLGTGLVHFWKQNKHGYTTVPGEAGKFLGYEANTIVHDDYDKNTISVAVNQFEGILRKYGEL